eukprot:scaffold14558_cov137-Cylindrotheca_fusiformis.AAC.13
MSNVLQGKRVLVTGGGRGIGRSIALICHKHGAQVAIASRTRSDLQETIDLALAKATDSSDCRMQLYEADVTSSESVDAMVQSIRDQWGGLDILINNAGGAQNPKAPMDELDSSDLTKILQLNVVGPQIVTSAVLNKKHPVMAKDGKIINISSRAGKVGLQNMSFYVASKFALEGMTASWAKELLDRNILVHSISPGMVDTKTFPKPAGKAGVRTADSVEDSLMVALLATKEYTGHYIHADELDMVRNANLPDSAAWKSIDETPFTVVPKQDEK